jgi:16S rRNA C967 or C1407 C5-methylase (RsmB/RsmF family)
MEEEMEMYDVVLLDAPCSGLGIMRSKPDIRSAPGIGRT